MNNSGEQLRRKCILLVMFATISVLFLFAFSWTTSPVFDFITKDSDIFVLMGQYAKQGMVPYRDFFDHKGPVLVFIQWLGAMIGEDKLGIFLLQCVAMFFTLYGMYKLVSIFVTERRSVGISVLSLMIMSMYLGGGNLTEEYCLPFIVWSLYFGLKNLSALDKGHNPTCSVFYGVTFGVCAFTRLTNALPLCCVLLIGFVVLIRKRMIQNILHNIICFIAGAVVVMLPFVIYCAVNGVFYEMIYATFIYNFRYAASGSYLSLFEKIQAMNFRVVPIVLMGVIGICGLIRKKKVDVDELTIDSAIETAGDRFYENLAGDNILEWFLVISGVIAVLFQFSGNGYEHYLLVWVPVIVVAECIFITYWEQENQRKIEFTSNESDDVSLRKDKLCSGKTVKYKMILGFVAIAFMVSVLTRNAMEVRKSYIALDDTAEKVFTREINQIVDMMDDDYGNDGYSVIAYNVYPYFYLESELVPCYKYFIMQDWQCGKDMEMYYDVKEDFCSLEADYIVMYTHQNRSNTYFGGIIEEYYTEVGRTERLKVFRRK